MLQHMQKLKQIMQMADDILTDGDYLPGQEGYKNLIEISKNAKNIISDTDIIVPEIVGYIKAIITNNDNMGNLASFLDMWDWDISDILENNHITKESNSIQLQEVAEIILDKFITS